MKNITWIVLLLSLLAINYESYAQAGDNCETALNIADPSNYCSGLTEFTLVNSTTSTYGEANCWNGQARDIWFKFTATALAVDIVVNGGGNSGQLNRPQVAIYSGVCGGTITNLQCKSDDASTALRAAQISTSLKIGQEYLIRVAGRSNTVGGFQLCVTNYNPIILPGQDCNNGAVLCDKSSFVVQSVTGAGLVQNEGDGTCLQPTFLSTSEDQSTWFKWTAADNGTLAFDIIPLKGDDDIDFALYEMNNINSCAGKSVLRCVATSCEGPTGIRLGENENSEDQGCEVGENGYVRSITQTAGKHYALLVNNFTQSKIGFKLNFGGTATFVGPQANFSAVPDPTCGTKFRVAFTGPVVAGAKYTWAFGQDASIVTANTVGPFDINFDEKTGERFITLTLESATGCKVTKTTKITLGSCCGPSISPKLSLGLITPPTCNGDKNAAVDLLVNGGTPPYQIKFNNGPSSTNLSYGNLASGVYPTSVVDSKGCKDSINVTILNVPVITVDAGPDKSISISTSTNLGATYSPMVAGDTYLWTPPLGIFNPNILNTTVTVDTTTTYYITVKNAKGCSGTDSVKITASCNPQALPKVTAAVFIPLCKGTATGKINLLGSGGFGALTYSIANSPFVSTLNYTNIKAGDYTVRVKDARGCIDSIPVRVPDPPSIIMNAGPDVLVDFRDSFFISASYTPRNPGDIIRWIPGSSVLDSTSLSTKGVALSDRTYILSVTNSDGCTTFDSFNLKIIVNCAKLIPPTLTTTSSEVACGNTKNGIITAKGAGIYPPFTYSISNGPYGQDSIFRNLGPARYTIATRDRLGCVARDSVRIVEADVYVVNAGIDQQVELGETAQLDGTYSPQNPGDSISWNPINLVDDPSSLTTEAFPSGVTKYVLNVKSYQGCIYKDSVVITTTKSYNLVPANVFKPGSTGNGNFNLVGSKTAKLIDKLDIYDRWGNKVYNGQALDPKDPTAGWDGKFNGEVLPTDVYIWVATIRFLDDNTQVFRGDITLVR